MDARAQELIRQGDNLFGKRANLLNLWQEIGENFYPIRSDFTTIHTPGDDLTAHLSNSYPLMAQRDLANNFSTMLRRRGTKWFKMWTGDDRHEEGAPRAWLDWARDQMYAAMYARTSQFVRSTKEGDWDFAAFGQAVLQIERNRHSNYSPLLFRNHHLRDCAWSENAYGQIDTMHRKWKATAREIYQMWGNKAHREVIEQATSAGKDPYQKFEVRHVMVPADKVGGYEKGRARHPFRSYYCDVQNQHTMEDVPAPLFQYVVPRWQTVSGSQYAYSPATVAALPDARMIQSMTYTLLDAGEKATQPPMLGQAGMLKSDLELYPGGTTWVDAEYDERLGEALRPIPIDLRGIPIGTDMAEMARNMIAEAFYLNKVALPPNDREMTAYETAQRIQEYIRQALPLFEPVEIEYNGGLCEMTFNTMVQASAFGDWNKMPEELSEANIDFKFMSPLQEAEDRQDAQIYIESKALIDAAVAADPSLGGMMHGRDALRDALKGAGAPEKWLRTDEEMDEHAERARQQMEEQQMAEQARAGGEAVEQVGKGAQALTDAMGVDPEALLDAV